MRFDSRNPKFLMDLLVAAMSVAIIILAVFVIIDGTDAALTAVFIVGAVMFAINMTRGLVSRRLFSLAFVIPMAICVTGALVAQGLVPIPELPF